MKPVDKFSIQYSELLEYIYPVTQEYFPDFGYDEETGQTYMLPSQTPDTFKGCLLYTSPSPRDVEESRMPSSA